MADIRINALANTATTPASDDYLALDGSAQGTRKILATNIANNVTDVILGTSGPSVKSTLSARAPRQGLVFDGTAGATVASVPAFGTSNYSFAVWVLYKTSSSPQALFDSGVNGCVFSIAANGQVLLYDRKASATRAASTTLLTAGKSYFLAYSRTGQIYINGVADGAQVADGSDYTSTTAFIGKSYANTEFCFGSISGALIYNRALSASEVVALYEAGAPAGADYNSASNTSKLTGANSDFSSAGNWTVTGSTTISGGKLNLSNGDQAYCTPGNISVPVGGKFRVTLTVDSITAGSVQVYTGGIGGWVNIATTAGTFTQEFTFSAASGPTPNLNLKSTGGNAVVDTVLYYQIGLLLAPDAAQAGGGLTWYDTSGNAANITLPASGVSWNVPTSGYVTSGSSLNLSAGGTNQNITLTPSGTGSVAASSTGANVLTLFRDITNTGVGTAIKLRQKDAASATVDIADIYAYKSVGTAGSVSSWLGIATRNAGTLTDAMYIAPSGNVVLGSTATDSSNGRLQLATHTTSAGGIGFGTDVSLYRSNAGYLTLLGTASLASQYFRVGSQNMGYLYFDTTDGYVSTSKAGASLVLRSGNEATALTLDGSQSASFAGNVRIGGTDKSLLLNGASTQFSREVDVRIAGDTEGRLLIRGGGSLLWGDGAGTFDSALARTAANMLTVTGSLTIGSVLKLGNAYVAGAPTATGYVTLQDSAGNTYKVLVGT